jgi:hypothetical protein
MREALVFIVVVIALIAGGVWLMNRAGGDLRSADAAGAVHSGGDEKAVENHSIPGSAISPQVPSVSGMNGVNVMSPWDAAFDGLAERLLPDWKKTIKNAKPLVTIISNTSQRRVVAFSVVFTMRKENGPPITWFVQNRAPDAVAGKDEDLAGVRDLNSRALLPGDSRVVGLDFQFGPNTGPHASEIEAGMERHIAEMLKE